MNKSLLLGLSLIAFAVLSSFSVLKENYFKIGSNSWSIDTAIIANESYGDQSKYEIDLINNQSGSEDSTSLIWLSVSGDKTTNLSEGFYSFGDIKNNAKHFFGQVIINKNRIDIVDGSFTIEKENNIWKINCLLKLKNGDSVTGTYSGKVHHQDRNKNYQKD